MKIRDMRSITASADECPGHHGLTFGRFLLDLDAKILWRDGKVLPLGPKVVHTLAILVTEQGHVVSRADLMRQVWGDTSVDENSLAHNISVLRKTLKEDSPEEFAIETIPRRGYRFCKLELQHPAQPALDASLATDAPSRDQVPEISLLHRFKRSWAQLVTASGALLCLGAVSISLTGYHLPPKQRGRRSVAVMGFVDLARQPESAWISPAIAEMMATELAAGGKLLTIPEESVARARAELKLENENGFSGSTLSKLRQDLDADIVVSGAYSVLASSDSGNRAIPSQTKVRLDLRIQDAHSAEVIDAISETGDQSNLFDLVTRAGIRVRQDLGVELPGPEESREASASVSSNPQAVQLYAQGRDKLRTYNCLEARDLLQRAVALDPKYALAHSALSEALGLLGYDAQSKQEAKTAFELAGNLSREEQLFIEGRYRTVTRDRRRAVEVYEKLWSLYPDNLDYGLQLSSAQIAASSTHEALATLNALRRLPPPGGSDPRISLKEYEVWKNLSDFRRINASLAEAEVGAKRQGASLLLARTKIRQCWVRAKLVQRQQALEDCQQAQQIYAAAGDRYGESDAFRLLGDLAAESDSQQAMQYYGRALAIQQEVGHLAGQASVLNQMAIQYSNHGDHVAAKSSYEQALDIFRRLDSRPDSIGILINVAYEAACLGQLDEAHHLYKEALATATQAGDKDIQGLAAYNSGLLQQLEGNLREAKQSYQQALMWFREVDDKISTAAALNTLGDVAMVEGDFSSSRRLTEEALSIQRSSRQTVAAAESEMNLAKLSLEERACSQEVNTSLLQLRDTFRQGGMMNDEAQALALLGRCLVSRKQMAPAMRAIEEATEISAKTEPRTRLSVAVTAARVGFEAHGNATRADSVTTLKRTVAEANRYGYASLELEARLILGELELQSGANMQARAELHAVEKDASRRGLLLIARRARDSSPTLLSER